MFTSIPLLRAVILALLLALALAVQPAAACGCGIYVPRNGDAQVSQEHALLRWDGQTEDLVMSLGVLGSSQQAAVILPVPTQADMKLGDASVFDELAEYTKPIIKQEHKLVFNMALGAGAAPPTAAVGAPPVSVLSRQTLGPFDVVNLAATDAQALKKWFDENGFEFAPQITEVLQPYVEQKWTFVAVRLQPAQATKKLAGMLDPLWVTFRSDELVYPMRPSAMAKNQQNVEVYVLADHRVDKKAAFGESRVAFAGWIEPSNLSAESKLAPLVSRKFFLTRFVDSVLPQKVHADFTFAFANQDTPYRETKIVTVEDDVTGWLLLGWLVFIGLGVLALVLVVAILIVAAVRRPTLSSPGSNL